MDPLKITYVCPEPINVDITDHVPFKWDTIKTSPNIYSIQQAIVLHEAYASRNIDAYTSALKASNSIELFEVFKTIPNCKSNMGNPWRLDMINMCIESQFNQFPTMKAKLMNSKIDELDQSDMEAYISNITKNTYGKLLVQLRNKFIIESQDIDTVVENVMNNLNVCITKGYGVSRIFISGSYPLHKIDTTINTPVSWDPNDIDIFIPHNISMNFMNHIHNTVFNDFEIIAAHNRCYTYQIPGHNKNIQIVRMNSDYQDFTAMYDSADISITQCFVIHNSSKINPCEYHMVPIFSGWSFLCRTQEYEDIKNKTQRFYRKSDDPYYEYGLKRIEKYKDRGFTNIILEPKELTDLLPMYEPVDGQYPLET